MKAIPVQQTNYNLIDLITSTFYEGIELGIFGIFMAIFFLIVAAPAIVAVTIINTLRRPERRIPWMLLFMGTTSLWVGLGLITFVLFLFGVGKEYHAMQYWVMIFFWPLNFYHVS
jgi:hypothetical protein